MKKLIVILTISTFCISGCLSNSGGTGSVYNFGGIEKIAIVGVTGKVVSEVAQDQIADLFARELLMKGYSPMRLAQVREEIQNYPEEITSYSELGQVLDVQALLVVDIPFLKDEIVINANLIEDGGNVLWMERGSGQIAMRSTRKSSGRTQEDYLRDPFLRFQEPMEDTSQLSMDMPGMRALSPVELENVEDIVYRICRSLPEANAYMSMGVQETGTQRTTQSRTPSYDW